MRRSFETAAPSGFALIPAAEAEAIRPAWEALAARALEPNPFLEPGFLLAAMRHLGEDDVRLAVVRDHAGHLVALAPLVTTRLGRVGPAVSVWCHRYAPRGAPLVDRESGPAALEALFRGIEASFGPRRAFVMPFLPAGHPLGDAIREAAASLGRDVAIVNAEARAALRAPETGTADPREALPRRKRKELGRQMRRLGELGTLSVETASEPGLVAARFEEFLTLEAAGWKGARGTALARDPASATFARAAVAGGVAEGRCRIHSIRLDDRPVAMLVSFLSGDLAATWKIAHDEAHARFSPGAQLMLEAAASLLAEPGLRRIDSCAAAGHPMIDHLWPGRLDVATLVVMPARGRLAARIGLAGSRMEARARRGLRSMLRGRR